VFVSAIFLIVAIVALIAINAPEPGGQPWNIPAGFAALEGNGAVAARFAMPTECSSAACVDLEVIARDGCPGGINVKALTGGGEGEINGLVLNQIDDPVAPMEIAVLPLTFEEPDVSQVRFEVFCYPE
jgi:hypothetical protein